MIEFYESFEIQIDILNIVLIQSFEVTPHSGNHVSFEEPCEQVEDERGKCQNMILNLMAIKSFTIDKVFNFSL